MSTLNTVKAINERLAVYERRGLTSSATYQDILNTIKLLDIPTSISRGGNIRISRGKEDLSKIDVADLARIEKIGGLKEEIKKVKERTGKNRQGDIYDEISNYGNLKKWSDENLTQLYNDARSGLLPEAESLENLYNEGLRNYDYATIFEKIRQYENVTNKIYEELNNGKYVPPEYFNPYL